MARPLSEDLRKRALARSDAGETDRAIGQALSISPSCLSKWRRLRRETGALKPGKMNGLGSRSYPAISPSGCANALLRGHSPPSACQRACGARDQDRSAGGWVFVRREGLSFKKTVLPAEQDRADIARKRCRWKTHQHRVDPPRLVFLDETWVKTNMAPLRGWGPKGKRLAASVPYGHWMTMTFIAALPSPPCHRRPALRPGRGALRPRRPDEWDAEGREFKSLRSNHLFNALPRCGGNHPGASNKYQPPGNLPHLVVRTGLRGPDRRLMAHRVWPARSPSATNAISPPAELAGSDGGSPLTYAKRERRGMIRYPL